MTELPQLPWNDVSWHQSLLEAPKHQLSDRFTGSFSPRPRNFRNAQIEEFCTKRVLSSRRELLIVWRQSRYAAETEVTFTLFRILVTSPPPPTTITTITTITNLPA